MRIRRLPAVLAALALLASVSLLPAADGPGGVVATLAGHTEMIYAVAFSPDGKLVVTGSFDQTLKLWDAATGKEVKTFGGSAGHQKQILTVAFSPDGQGIASGGQDNLIKIWDVPRTSPLRQFTAGQGLTAVALAPDGSRLAAAGVDGKLTAWTTAEGKNVWSITAHRGPVTGLAPSGNGQLLATGGEDHAVRFWNVADGKPVGALGAHAGTVAAVAFHPNNTLAVSAGHDGLLKFWQLPVAAPRAVAAHADAVGAVALSPDGNLVVSGGADRAVRVGNLGNGQAVRQLAGASAAVTSLTASGLWTAAGTADRWLLVWNSADGALLSQSIAHAGPVTAVAISPQNNQMVTAGGDGVLKRWALPVGPARTAAHPDAVLAAALSRDGQRLYTAAADRVVRAWTLVNNQFQPARPFPAHAAPVTAIAVSANGQLLAAAGKDGNVRLSNPNDGKDVATISGHKAAITGLAFHPAGNQLASGSEDGTLKVWQVPPPQMSATNKTLSASPPLWQSGPEPERRGVSPPVPRPEVRKNQRADAPPLGAVRRILYSARGDQIFAASDDRAVRVWNAADGKLLRTIPAHDGAVTGLAVSADGARVVSAGTDKTLKVWGAAAKEEKPALTLALAGPVEDLALSPDGTRAAVAVALGDKAHRVQIIDLATGKELAAYGDYAGPVRALAFAADGRTLLSAADKEARLTDVNVLSAFDAHPGGVAAVAFHANGTQVLAGGADRAVRLWDLNAGKPARTFGTLSAPVTAVAFSRDFALAAAAGGQTALVWSAGDGKQAAALAHPADVLGLAFSPDRARLLTGAADGRARLWDLATGQELESFDHTGPVRAVAFHPNNRDVIVAGADKAVTVHTPALVRAVRADARAVRALAVVPSGSHVLTAGDDKAVKIWNAGNGNLERSLAGDGSAGLAVCRNNLLVAAAGRDQTVRIFGFADGKPLAELKTSGPVRGLAFSPSNQALAAACAGGRVRTWNVAFTPGQPLPPEFGQPVQAYEQAGPAADVVFAPDGGRLFSAGADPAVREWKFAADVPTRNLPHPNLVDAVAYNPAGTLLATACHDGLVRLWDPAKGVMVREIKAHVGPQPYVYCLAWSPDGKQLVSGSYDRSLKLWDAATGGLVREFKGYKEKEFEKGHTDGVFCVAFSPDGKRIASGSSDHAVKIWNAATGTVMAECVHPGLQPLPPPGSAQAHPGWVYGLKFTPDGKYLVSAGNAPGNRGFLGVWSAADGKMVYGDSLAVGPIYALALSPDGKLAALGCGPAGRSADAQGVILRLLGRR